MLVRDGLVLCEVREWGGRVRNSALGGGIDPVDREAPDYCVAALLREMAEELGVEPSAYRLAGEAWLRGEWLFYVYVVDGWRGELPLAVLDTGRPLRWVHPTELIADLNMPDLVELVREHVERNGGER
jgi:8-oxo-dGTP pyrophosphatase MutT (NUDIX family)